MVLGAWYRIVKYYLLFQFSSFSKFKNLGMGAKFEN